MTSAKGRPCTNRMAGTHKHGEAVREKGAVLLSQFQVFGRGSCLIRQLQKSLIEEAIWPRGNAPDDKHAPPKHFPNGRYFHFFNC